MMLAVFGLPELIPIIILLGILGTWIYALVDCIRVPDAVPFRAGTRLIWVIVILLAPFFGSLIYFAIGRPQRTWKQGDSKEE
jgi:hypothetical protein